MLRRQPLVWGPIYGVLVYWFMQLVVLNQVFSNRRPPQPRQVAIGIAVHILAVGLPAALFARKARYGTFGLSDPLGRRLAAER